MASFSKQAEINAGEHRSNVGGNVVRKGYESGHRKEENYEKMLNGGYGKGKESMIQGTKAAMKMERYEYPVHNKEEYPGLYFLLFQTYLQVPLVLHQVWSIYRQKESIRQLRTRKICIRRKRT